ncbi:thioesterase [Fulvivirga sp. M361]|uniref:thioesterase II family protein n=1 Tax=Fulvivirga sp. M361 TaxID=2594266 RepID=UPI00117B01E1|nr:alpha/beta fold hydrolase [Fulvivirga sp. M361]TRX53349.1 thioesterase [Fulvivirga sp. M361]
MEKTKIYLLPFSGASKYSYAQYAKIAPPTFEMIPVEIPGRGMRASEESLTDIHKIVDDIFLQIKDGLQTPYVIYGHSLGGLLGYLLVHKIVEAGLSIPLHLFFTGCVAPSVRYRGLVDHLLPKEQFIQKIKELGGSPDAILNDKALMEFFIPILRADFQAVAEFQYKERPRFDVNMTILIGSEEEASFEEAQAWQKETTGEIDVKMLQGNHFFIFDHPKIIMKILTEKVNSKIPTL